MRITNVEADNCPDPPEHPIQRQRLPDRVSMHHSRAGAHGRRAGQRSVLRATNARGYELLKDLVVGPMAEAVTGEDPMAIERCWQMMFALTPHIGNKAIAMRAIAAIDIALWDIAGKALGVPVRTMLGGYAERSPVVRFAYYVQGRDTAFMVEDLVHQRERGIGGVKLKVGGIAVADDLAAGAGDSGHAGRRFHHRVRRQSGVDAGRGAGVRGAGQGDGTGVAGRAMPLAGCRTTTCGRCVCIPGFRWPPGRGRAVRGGGQRLMDTEAVDILNIDAAICGGISEWRRVAGAAQMRGVRMAHHEEPQLAVQLLPAHAHGLFVEVFEEERDPVYYQLNSVLPRWDNGEIIAPDEPGMGPAPGCGGAGGIQGLLTSRQCGNPTGV